MRGKGGSVWCSVVAKTSQGRSCAYTLTNFVTLTLYFKMILYYRSAFSLCLESMSQCWTWNSAIFVLLWHKFSWHVKQSDLPLIAFWFFADSHDGGELLPLSPLAPPLEEDPLLLVLQNEDGTDKTGEKKNSEELQSLWRKAIHQQILLLRMEKENQKLEG